MLKKWEGQKCPSEDELIKRLDEARIKLVNQQLKLKDGKVPVLIMLEGFCGAGKGSLLSKIIKELDPRFFKVDTIDKPSEDELRKPFLYKYFRRIPEAGRIGFFEGGWMDEVVEARICKEITEKEYRDKIDSIRRFERSLSDNGYLVLKFFVNIDEREQKKRFEELEASKNTRWRVTKKDWFQNKKFDKYVDAYDEYMNDTSLSCAPWYIIDGKHKKWALLQTLDIINQGIDTALANTKNAVPIIQNIFPMDSIPKLCDISLNNKTMTEQEYRVELEKCQKKLGELHNKLYRKKIPVIIAYEGWDAAGKGGNIKRIAAALDPRGYEVIPIASPLPNEKARHFLWRFWTRLPRTGHIAIFDRTWYGRVMVERLEGFCSENDWQRAYNEINEFEKELYDWGAIIIKFWVQIDKDTQLERFTLRQNTPEKQWKITDEDWRNREKWDLYEDAIDEMLQKTNTSYANWHILESNDKKYARIKALKTVIKEIEKRLE